MGSSLENIHLRCTIFGNFVFWFYLAYSLFATKRWIHRLCLYINCTWSRIDVFGDSINSKSKEFLMNSENYNFPFGPGGIDDLGLEPAKSFIIWPFLGLEGEYSVILDGGSIERFFSVDLLADDEFDAVRRAIEQTGWNYPGQITVDNLETITDDLEPLLCFQYEVLSD